MPRKFWIILTHEGRAHMENGIPYHYDEVTGLISRCEHTFACEQLTIGKKRYIIREVAERIAERQNDSPGNKNFSFTLAGDQASFVKRPKE